jgi:hypothetical protein
MSRKLLIAIFIVLFLLTTSLIGTYIFVSAKRTSFNKVVENNMDFVYKIVSGGNKFYIPSGINIELKNPDGSYLYSLSGKIVDVNLSEKTMVFENKAGELFNISLSNVFTINSTGEVVVKTFEATPQELNWKEVRRNLKLDDIEAARDVFCDSGLVSLSWGDKNPLSYWEQTLTNTSTNTVVELPGLVLHIIRGYETKNLFKQVTISKYSTCF